MSKAFAVGGMKIASIALSFIISLLLARQLQPEGYGSYVFVVSLVTLIALPVNAGIPRLLVREVAKYQVDDRWNLMRGLLRRGHQVTMLLSVLILFVIIILCSVKASWNIDDQWTLLLLAVPLIPLMALRNLRSSVLQGLRKVVQGQMPEMVVQPSVFLAGISFLLAIGMLSPAWTIVARVGASFVSFGVGTWLLLKMLPVEVHEATPEYEDKPWLRALVPFTLLAGVSILSSETIIVLLGIFADIKDVGLYRVASSGALFVSLPLMIVNSVISPYVSRLYHEGDMKRLQVMATKSARVVLVCALPFSLLFVFQGDRVLDLLFGKEYLAAHAALVILTVGHIVNAAMGSVGLLLTMTGHERQTLNGLLMALGVTVVFSAALIPLYGTVGAAIASTLSLITWNVYLYKQVYEQLRIKSAAWVSISRAS